MALIAAGRAQAPGIHLLSLLIQAGLSDDLIRDQLLTMLIAGHDTATAMLSWTVYALGQNPAVLRTARAEVDAVLGDQAPDATTIQRLPYLERVVKETLRLYPPIHAGNRRAARNLEFGGYQIAAGTRLLFSIYLTHRHADHWTEPERFDPERFNPEAAAPPAAMTYLPFGGGPRFCIGTSLAQIEARVVLARLLQAIDFELKPGRMFMKMGATLEPATHLPMRVQRRHDRSDRQWASANEPRPQTARDDPRSRAR
jgi:cytochrome P450